VFGLVCLFVDVLVFSSGSRAKVVCLGSIYGMGPMAAAVKKLGIDIGTVTTITNAFFHTFSGVKKWIQSIKLLAKQKQEVRTLSGRLRLLPDIRSDDPKLRATAERQAVNTVIQGTASDLIKTAMLMVAKALYEHDQSFWKDFYSQSSLNNEEASHRTTNILMQIHDELVFEVPLINEMYLQKVIQIIQQVMEVDLVEQWKLKVPLITNLTIGENWGNMTSIQPPFKS
jgi:DNA polymerase I